ncbi:MAG: hypothetical protein OXM88_18935, partial [bacterium]|nr:hypothetical protein [bacterium]
MIKADLPVPPGFAV